MEILNDDEYQKRVRENQNKLDQEALMNYYQHRIEVHLQNSMGLADQYLAPLLINDVDNGDENLNKALLEITRELENHQQFSTVLYGAPGVGKTHNSLAMMWQFINDTLQPAFFMGMQATQKLITDEWNNRGLTQQLYDVKKYAKNASLLIIDDLGAEVPSRDFFKPAPMHVNNFLYEIVSARRMNDLPIIVNSNLAHNSKDENLDQYKAMYDGRVISRLLPKDDNYWIKLIGEDRRK